ncbi:hypothetical protein [Methanobrevibacter sp.]|uniref:hypothetical protein n=1 Tax=Methanobrevibacter sp. TaxID=66852 RepID=UPI00388E308D
MEEDKTISDEIDIQIQHQIQQIPQPILCIIRKVYSDNHVDVETDMGVLNYIELMGYTKEGAKGILLFLDGSIDNPLCISLDLTNILTRITNLEQEG